MQTFSLSVSKTSNATLTAYLLDNSDTFRPERLRSALIICPGGGYSYCSVREGEPIALRFNALGFQTFVLNYSVAPAEYPTALTELANAVRLVREHAAEWHIHPDQIAIAGFSAGGHLAANLCCRYSNADFLAQCGFTQSEICPNACVLSYPVITSGPFAHRGSFENLLGSQSNEELLKEVSLELQVTPDVPPTFLWHTFEDGAVPVENSLFYVQALRNAGVLCEFHMYPFGGHGLALATEETSAADGHQIVAECSEWPELASRFLHQIFHKA